MRSYRDIQAQQENVDRGGLKVTVMTADGTPAGGECTGENIVYRGEWSDD